MTSPHHHSPADSQDWHIKNPNLNQVPQESKPTNYPIPHPPSSDQNPTKSQMPAQHITWANPPKPPRHLPLYKNPHSQKAYLSPLLASRGFHRSTAAPKRAPRSPTLLPLNIQLANSASEEELYAVPKTRPPCTPPLGYPYPLTPAPIASSAAPRRSYRKFAALLISRRPSAPPPLPLHAAQEKEKDEKAEWPPCPLRRPHLHGDMNPHRPYMHHSRPPDQRHVRMLREFDATKIWEGGNPPPGVWDALFRIFLGEGEERAGDVETVFAWRYWHCVRFREGCLGGVGRGEGDGRREVGRGDEDDVDKEGDEMDEDEEDEVDEDEDDDEYEEDEDEFADEDGEEGPDVDVDALVESVDHLFERPHQW